MEAEGGAHDRSTAGLSAIFALALLRVPLAFAMGIVGVVGMGLTRGWPRFGQHGPGGARDRVCLHAVGHSAVHPDGQLCGARGLAHELFHAAYVFIGHLRGGLAHATIAACAGFGAICGSSIATAATMSKVAYPSMKKLGYSDSLSTGVIAAGGTLGIMIPPSPSW
jgi:C4-dicarboxylate transporter DctM subunit